MNDERYDHENIRMKFGMATAFICVAVARSVSNLLGFMMLLAVFLFTWRWGGIRRGIFTILLLASMPQFYRYSHWILLDIGVGAFCTISLVAFAYWIFLARERRNHPALFLFYLAGACAFLTKGVVGLFHVAVTVGAFLIMTKRRNTLRPLLSPLPLLKFIIPVCLWIYLYYQEGWICYLHEHFVNNILGRFLRRHFEFAGCHFYHTDLGNKAPWFFYIQRLSDMIGLNLLFLPFAIWSGFKKIVRPRKPPVTEQRSQDGGNSIAADPDIFLFLILWAFLPGFLLSFSSIKEVRLCSSLLCGHSNNYRGMA